MREIKKNMFFVKNVKDVFKADKTTCTINKINFAHKIEYFQGNKFLLNNVIIVKNFIQKIKQNLSVLIVYNVILVNKRIIFNINSMTQIVILEI